MNLASLVSRHRADAPSVHDGRSWTSWGELRARAAGVRAALSRSGVVSGDRVAVIWPSSVEFVASYLGVLAAGAVAVPLNPSSPGPELRRQLDAVSASAVLVPEATAGALGGWPGELVVGAPPASDDDLTPVDRHDDDPAVLLFTSGTAGAPRPAVLSHGNLRANLEQMLALPGDISRPDDVAFSAVPLFHVFGLNVALGLALATGSGLVLEARFDPAGSLAAMGDLGVTTVLGVPPMFASWADLADGRGEASLRSLRLAVSGAAALAPELAARFEQELGLSLWQGYGLTEASPSVATTVGTGRNRPGSVGRPLPGVELRLVDDDGAEALAGDPGEIWVRGPNVFGGYWQDQKASAEALTADGWLRTGDIGVLGDDGDLYVVDRRKDLIVVSGFNVYPAEVEEVVAAVAGVADAVALGRPDPLSGESVEVVVVADPGGPEVTEETVRQACSAALARYKCPAVVRFVDELPRGLAGKALRRELREQQPL